MYPPFEDDADPTDERMVSALNFALSGRGDAVDDAALALGLALAGRTSGGHGGRHSSLSPSESSVASTTSMMSTSSFASSLAPSDAPADEHVVLPGDTLAGICIRYGVSARSLRRLNRLDEGDQVMQHAILRIPERRRRETPQAQTPDVLAARQRLAYRESGAWTEDESFRVAIRIINGRRVR